MKLRLLFAATILIAGAITSSAAPFTNGSFENGTDPGVFSNLPSGSTAITGWVVGGAGGVDYIGTYWQAADGTRSLDLDGTSAGSVSQTFDTVINMPYLVTFSLAGNPAGAPSIKTLTVSAGATTTPYSFNTAGATTSNMNWTPETFSFIATGASTTLTFASTTDGSFGPALDNVGVSVAMPEPGTSAMLISGLVLGITGLIRRKRA